MKLAKRMLGFREGTMSLYVINIIYHSPSNYLADHEIFSSYIALDQIRRYSLLEPVFPGIQEKLYLKLPTNLSELDFSRGV